jgi:hypothetical protein
LKPGKQQDLRSQVEACSTIRPVRRIVSLNPNVPFVQRMTASGTLRQTAFLLGQTGVLNIQQVTRSARHKDVKLP